MEAPAHRTWMYDRLLPGRRGYTTGFLKGVEEFIGFACRQEKYLNEGVIRCPCKLCKNEDHLTPDEVNVHIHRKGFIPGYWHWTCHGEELPCVNVDIYMDAPSSSSQQWGYEHVGRHQDMVFDAAGITHELSDEEEPPNMKAAEFYAMLNSAQRPLYPGCQNASELSVAVEMLSIKSKHNMSQACFNDIMKFMKKSSHPENVIPPDFRQTKKLVGGLGLSKMKIDCCVNGCMLYYKDDISLKECKFCNQPRYKARTVRKRNSKDVPRKRLHYLPLIPRLQRLYASVKTAEHMRWHYENRREEGVLCHPSDGEAWKHFDQVYPEFASEPRNVRLGLCADGFTPFNQSSTQYSIWPVIVTPYNLPPELCMMTPYMFLTLIIPGPRSPRGKIDVYLQPLIDELQILWNDGVETYDASKKQNFLLRAALMWTINDFPAYGMLSGWSTSWKQLFGKMRDEWFKLFEKKFTWPPAYKDKVRRNFEKRGAAKMSQLMQEARQNLDEKPYWMGEAVWGQLKAYWDSSKFKKKSAINRRNRESLDGASLHTGGSIPHRVHWKRMKEEKGTDPSLTDFFFRTHRKKDQSWVGPHAEAAYDKFEQKTYEISSQNSTFAPGEDEANSQPTIDMPSDMDIWVDTVGKKKGRIFGLGSVSKTLIPSSSKTTNNLEEVDALKSLVHALNESLQRQEEEKVQMRKDLNETKRQVTILMEHLGYAASSSRPHSSPQNDSESEDDGDSDHLD